MNSAYATSMAYGQHFQSRKAHNFRYFKRFRGRSNGLFVPELMELHSNSEPADIARR